LKTRVNALIALRCAREMRNENRCAGARCGDNVAMCD